MGLHGMLRGQMVKVIEIKEVKNEETGKITKVALFKVAGRDKNKNAKGEYVSDFYLCKAFGVSAEMIEKYFDNTDENGNVIKGKSRKLDLIGHMQSYPSVKEENKDKSITGKQVFGALGIKSPGEKYDKAVIPLYYTMKVQSTEWVFIVDKVLFADSMNESDDSVKVGSIAMDRDYEDVEVEEDSEEEYKPQPIELGDDDTKVENKSKKTKTNKKNNGIMDINKLSKILDGDNEIPLI